MSNTGVPANVHAWALFLAQAELPVLRRTIAELERFRADEDKVSCPQLSAAILHDPIMTLKLLRYLQAHRAKRQAVDITTIDHAMMMLGLTPFFEHFSELSAFEDRLVQYP